MCKVDCIYLDQETENETLPQERISAVSLRDKCDRILGLLQCLEFVVSTGDFLSFTRKPHLDLFMVIEDEIKMIDKALEDL